MRLRRALAAAAAVTLALTLAGCSTAAGYVAAGEKIISAENMEKQWDYVTRDWNALQTSADNACAASAEATKEDADPTLVESPGFAYAATYRKVWAGYNARMTNIFEAGFTGPPGYPRDIPNYVTGPNPDFCQISMDLLVLKAEAE